MSKIIFDTETTGLPAKKGWDLYYPPKQLEKYNNSRLVQLGYIVLDNTNTVVKRKSFLVKPDNFTINNSYIHGITTEEALQNGINIKKGLEEFENDLKKSNTLIAHNMLFDYHILLSECHRYSLNSLIELIREKEHYCTMKQGQTFMNQWKSPKLTELFSHLYPNETWNQKHDALDDCDKCLKCYLKLSKF